MRERPFRSGVSEQTVRERELTHVFRMDVVNHVVRTVQGVTQSVLISCCMESFDHTWTRKQSRNTQTGFTVWRNLRTLTGFHIYSTQVHYPSSVMTPQCPPNWGFCATCALSSLTLGLRSDTSQGRNSGAVVTLIRNSITVSLRNNQGGGRET